MAIPTMGYMVPVAVAERQDAINRDLGAGFTYEEALRRNDPSYQTGYDNPGTGYLKPVPHKERVAQGNNSGGSSGMSLADLFDNSKWETHEIAAAPKRGGTVERRRYIGKNPMAMEDVGVDYGPTRQSGANQPVDDLGERFRNRDTRGPVTLFPVDSLDKQDMLDVAGRDYGIHGNETPYYDQEPPVPDPSWWDQVGEFGTDAWKATKNFGAPAWEKVGRGWDWANQPLAPPTTLSPEAEEARRYGKGIIPSRDIGTADRAIIDQNIRNISEQFVSDRIKQEYAQERARYQELVAQGMDEVTAAIMAGREFKRPTGETRAERRDREAVSESANKFDLIRYLQGLWN